MPTDFVALVLKPGMVTFARPVTVTPLKSLPNAVPYPARGVWQVEVVSIVTEESGNLLSVSIKLGIIIGEYPAMPMQGDWITSLASDLPLSYWQNNTVPAPTSSIDLVVSTVTPDGQGGANLILNRRTTP